MGTLERQTSAARLLCRLEEIPESGAKGIEIGEGADALDLILLRRNGRILGYLNSCPHQWTPLDIFPDKFLDRSGNLLICSTHGARFRADDGFCVWGPCQGARLTPVAIKIEAGAVWLAD